MTHDRLKKQNPKDPATRAGTRLAPDDTTARAHDDLVQQAVEDFIDRCSAGESPVPERFAETWPADARQRIAARCRTFLEFDNFAGPQSWAQTDLEAPDERVFGDYVIKEELGRGGMGIVYLAQQRSLNRRVALKVMASGLSLSRRHVERFRLEATQTAQLQHPSIVPVHSFTEVDGTFALAMEYIAGRNLGDILDDLRLANGNSSNREDRLIEGSLGLQPEKGYVAECALLTAQIAGALAAAHAAGIVHRDLKPRNIMVDDSPRARLLDFGLAKSVDDHSVSHTGDLTGTTHYLSPEQTLAKRMPQDHRTDIWSLGVILYELLTLQRPFDDRNLQQIVYGICFKEPVAISKYNSRVPRDLITICNRALEKDPARRYQTAADFEADLLRFLRWEPVRARPISPITRAVRWTQRNRTETALAAVVILFVFGWLTIDWMRDVHAPAAQRTVRRRGPQSRRARQLRRSDPTQHA